MSGRKYLGTAAVEPEKKGKGKFLVRGTVKLELALLQPSRPHYYLININKIRLKVQVYRGNLIGPGSSDVASDSGVHI